MRPKVLYCIKCYIKEAKIKEEEAYIVDGVARIMKELERATIEYHETSVETA